jgi:hypothetical protein
MNSLVNAEKSRVKEESSSSRSYVEACGTRLLSLATDQLVCREPAASTDHKDDGSLAVGEVSGARDDETKATDGRATDTAGSIKPGGLDNPGR